MSRENALVELPGTNMFISGLEKIDLSLPQSVEFVKERKVKKVFLILYQKLLENPWALPNLGDIQTHLRDAGIEFIPVIKRPNDIGTFELVSKKLETVHGANRALVMCHHGKHNSGAYAAYHLLKHGYGLKRTQDLFAKNGWGRHDVMEIENILANAFKSKQWTLASFAEHNAALMRRRGLAKVHEVAPGAAAQVLLARKKRAKRFAKKR